MRSAIAVAVWLMLVAAAPAAAQQSDDFHWSGSVPRGKFVEIRGINGDIHAEVATGNDVEVVARKTARRGNPADVNIVVVPRDSSVIVCAVYPGSGFSSRRTGNSSLGKPSADDEPAECRSSGERRDNNDKDDVRVDFTVRIPAQVRLRARTVNGAVEGAALRSDVDARTVNGSIAISTSATASAAAVNGSIDVSLGATSWSDPLDFQTVNGDVTVGLPKGVSADIRADMLNGRFSSDLPMQIVSTPSRRGRVTGTIGAGGHELNLHTVNGRISVRATGPN